MGAAHRLLD
jgi:hypothetical protein